jgi:NADH-quinone oxidoreductase subunit M
MGTYGLLRFGLYLFPEASVWAKPVFFTLATIGIIYGAIAATMQKDLKRLVAYSSVAHLGFIVLGTFAITSQALTGSVVQMVNHGVSTGALYLLWAYQRVFHGEPDEENSKFAELNLREGVLIGVFIVIIGFTGLYPKPMLDRVEPSVNKLIEHVESKSDYVAPQPKSSEHKSSEYSPAEGDE